MRYGVFYKGLLAVSHVTRGGAEKHAYQLCKAKHWDIKDVEVKQVTK